jgi:hypothetical protein
MKKTNLTKFLILSFLFAVLSISAQNNSQALKFDEFAVTDFSFYFSYDQITVAQKAERFAKQMRKQTGAKAYIIYYQSRITENNSEIRYLAERIKRDVSNERLAYDDVVIVSGGFRENAAFEFWIAPKNAAPPEPTPTFAKSETFVCPKVIVDSENLRGQSETIVFSVRSYFVKDVKNYTLKWQVSGGEIVEGQGTDIIKVRLNDSAKKRVTAFLEIEGLPLPCRKNFTATAQIESGNLILLDGFGQIPNGETRARLDYFLSELQKNPTAKGYVIVYGNRTSGAGSVESRIKLYKHHFTFRGFDSAPINIVQGGYREEAFSEMWLSFGDEKPVPTPTVDAKFVKIPKPARKPRRK